MTLPLKIKNARALYRCRKCGEVFAAIVTTPQDAEKSLIRAARMMGFNGQHAGVFHSDSEFCQNHHNSHDWPAVTIHGQCSDGDPLAGQGLGDLIGYDLD